MSWDGAETLREGSSDLGNKRLVALVLSQIFAEIVTRFFSPSGLATRLKFLRSDSKCCKWRGWRRSNSVNPATSLPLSSTDSINQLWASSSTQACGIAVERRQADAADIHAITKQAPRDENAGQARVRAPLSARPDDARTSKECFWQALRRSATLGRIPANPEACPDRRVSLSPCVTTLLL